MGGDTTTQSLIRGGLQDTGQAPERVVSGGKDEGEGGGGGQTGKSNRRKDDVRNRQDGTGGGEGCR